jgi:hypothetical protein
MRVGDVEEVKARGLAVVHGGASSSCATETVLARSTIAARISVFRFIGARSRTRHIDLPLGYPAALLIITLARATLREDADFHTCQMLDAGVREYREWGDCDEGRHILIAVARYLAAHSVTERALLQTAMVARRLRRGQALHEQAVSD